MALIRGLRGLRACPKCLIPSDKLSDLSQTYEPRTAAETFAILDSVKSLSAEGREEILKAKGLQYVPVGSFTLISMDSKFTCMQL